MHPLAVNSPAFTPQQHRHPTVTVSRMCPHQFQQPGLQTPLLVLPSGTLPLGVGVQGSSVSPERLFENRLIELRFGEQLLEAAILFFQLSESLCLLGLHAAVLVPPAMEGLLADFQRLADLAQRLAHCQHRVRFLKFADDLLGRMLLAFHREPPAAFLAALDSHNLWISFWGADQGHPAQTRPSWPR